MPAALAYATAHPLVIIEAGITLAAVLAAIYGWMGATWARKSVRALTRIAGSNTRSIVLAGASVVLLRVAVLPWQGVPEPGVHDEFSYLLAADTFASGRLTNPPHPMWIHFETFHVIHKPTYASIYPPAQGLILAAGKIIFGHPWAGVWLSCVLLACAVCWMLSAWLPPPWPLIGAVLLAVRLCTFSYWINSYWGGSVAAIGGALVSGSVLRLKQHRAAANAVVLAIGISILAASRPYEGLVLCLGSAVPVITWLLRAKGCEAALWRRRVVPAFGAVLASAGVLMGYYQWRVTGNPFLMPHVVNQRMYAPSSPFVWQSAPARPVYHHRTMQVMYSDYYAGYERIRTPRGFVKESLKRVTELWLFFLGPALSLPLLAVRRLFRDERVRFLLWTCAAGVAAILAATYFRPHYFAPFAPAVYGVLIAGLRKLSVLRSRRNRWGLALAGAVPVICAVMLILRTAADPLGIPYRAEWRATWYNAPRGNLARADLLDQLRRSGERHLVIVRYDDNHSPHEEWVYNDADIDNSAVVWARDMGPTGNRALIAYYKSRRIWLLKPDRRPLRLEAYPDHEAIAVFGTPAKIRRTASSRGPS